MTDSRSEVNRNDLISLRNDLDRMWHMLIYHRHQGVFDTLPRTRQIAMMSRMIQCEKDISDMIDSLDLYLRGQNSAMNLSWDEF